MAAMAATGVSIDEDRALLEEFLGPAMMYSARSKLFHKNPFMLGRNLRRRRLKRGGSKAVALTISEDNSDLMIENEEVNVVTGLVIVDFLGAEPSVRVVFHKVTRRIKCEVGEEMSDFEASMDDVIMNMPSIPTTMSLVLVVCVLPQSISNIEITLQSLLIDVLKENLSNDATRNIKFSLLEFLPPSHRPMVANNTKRLPMVSKQSIRYLSPVFLTGEYCFVPLYESVGELVMSVKNENMSVKSSRAEVLSKMRRKHKWREKELQLKLKWCQSGNRTQDIGSQGGGAIIFHYMCHRKDIPTSNNRKVRDNRNMMYIDESDDETIQSSDGEGASEVTLWKLGNEVFTRYVEIQRDISCPWCHNRCPLAGTNLIASPTCTQSEAGNVVAWSKETRSHLTAFLIHLRSYHSEFRFDLCADLENNLHVVVEKQCLLKDDNMKGAKRSRTGKKLNSHAEWTGVLLTENNSNEHCPVVATIQSHNMFSLIGKGGEATERFTRQYIDKIHFEKSHLLPKDSLDVLSQTKKLSSSAYDDNDDDMDADDEGETMDSFNRERKRFNNKKDIEDQDADAADNDNDDDNDDIDDDNDEAKWGSIEKGESGKGRVYYTTDGKVEKDASRFYSVDAAINNIWTIEHTNRIISEYLDVNLNEKVFMCKWNEHIAASPVYADMWMPHVAQLFARRHAHFLLRHNLRYVFLLHLISLWDHSLLSFDNVETCIKIVDEVMVSSSDVLRNSQI